jgi:hypothetical protein
MKKVFKILVCLTLVLAFGFVLFACNGNGYQNGGNGNGGGSGSGYQNGSGSGTGNENGENGNGYENGSGSGTGTGNGSGSGNGNENGGNNGNGNGNGSGNGNGNGTDKCIFEQIQDAIDANPTTLDNPLGFPTGSKFVGARAIQIGGAFVFQVIFELEGQHFCRYITADPEVNRDMRILFRETGPFLLQIGGNINSRPDGTPNDFSRNNLLFTSATMSEAEFYGMVLSTILNQPAYTNGGILALTGSSVHTDQTHQAFVHFGHSIIPAENRYITTQEAWDALLAIHAPERL